MGSWFWIGLVVFIVIFALVLMLALCKVAADADDHLSQR